MDIILSLGLIIVWLTLLILGGDILVDGSVSIARKYKLPEIAIGLTIVAIWTSMPEFIVGLVAIYEWTPQIAVANILGTNAVNIFLILGLMAFFTPIVLSTTTKKFDIPIGIAAMLCLLILMSDHLFDATQQNMLSRMDGLIMFLLGIGYVIFSLKKHATFQVINDEQVETVSSLWKSVFWVVWGMIVLFIWGKLLVDGAVDLARLAGLSETVIGLTIIAIGTSAPEMITGIISAKKWKPGIAVGNIIWSSTLNILIILWLPIFIGGSIAFDMMAYEDVLVALLAPVILFFFAIFHTPGKIDRIEGSIMVIFYIIYLSSILLLRI